MAKNTKNKSVCKILRLFFLIGHLEISGEDFKLIAEIMINEKGDWNSLISLPLWLKVPHTFISPTHLFKKNNIALEKQLN